MTTQSFQAFTGRVYNLERSFPTNISAEYLNDSGSKWGVWEMLRESIQNMMDEAEYLADTAGGNLLDYCKVSLWKHERAITYGQRGWLELRDKGRGVDWEKIFLIGESGKRGSHYRGQKGEGEGLSFLVATRMGIDKIMFSQDWAVKARLDNYADSNYKVLVFDLYRTKTPIEGTAWRYYTDTCPAIENYYRDLGSYFPQLSKQEQRHQDAIAKREQQRQQYYDNQYRKNYIRQIKAKSTNSSKMIITPFKGKSARLFVKGIYVKDIFALFSYNLKNVEINRDRSMVNEWEILKEIQTAFDSEDLTMAQAIAYWKNAQDSVGDAGLMEYKTVINLSNNQYMMLDAFYKAFGKKACVFTNKVAALDAQSLGFKVVDLHPYAKDTAMNLGIRADRVVLGYDGDIKELKPNAKQKQLISKLDEIGKALRFKNYKIIPVDKMLGVNDENLGGMYQNGKIFLMKSTLEGSRLYLLEVYIHEAGHGESGASDATRDFTNWFERLAVAALTGKHDGVRKLIDELVQI